VKRAIKVSPLLLALLALLLGGWWSYGRYGEYSSKRVELEDVRREVEDLRLKVQQLRIVEAENRVLTSRLDAIPWPPDLRVKGVGWITQKLEPLGWRIASAKLVDRGLSQNAPIQVREIEVRITGSVEGYAALMRGLSSLLNSRLSLQNVKVISEESGLKVELLALALSPLSTEARR